MQLAIHSRLQGNAGMHSMVGRYRMNSYGHFVEISNTSVESSVNGE